MTSPATIKNHIDVENWTDQLETAFDIIVTHERRHFEQSKEVFEIMKREAKNP
jgi:hypothetical protein